MVRTKAGEMTTARALRRRRPASPGLLLLHGDGPLGVTDAPVVGDRVTLRGRPAWDGVGGLGAVEVDGEVVAVGQARDGVLGLHERERADLSGGLQGERHGGSLLRRPRGTGSGCVPRWGGGAGRTGGWQLRCPAP